MKRYIVQTVCDAAVTETWVLAVPDDETVDSETFTDLIFDHPEYVVEVATEIDDAQNRVVTDLDRTD